MKRYFLLSLFISSCLFGQTKDCCVCPNNSHSNQTAGPVILFTGALSNADALLWAGLRYFGGAVINVFAQTAMNAGFNFHLKTTEKTFSEYTASYRVLTSVATTLNLVSGGVLLFQITKGIESINESIRNRAIIPKNLEPITANDL